MNQDELLGQLRILIDADRLEEAEALLRQALASGTGPLVLFAAAGGVERALQALKRDGTTANHLKELMLFNEINELNCIDNYRAMETRYTKG